MVAWAIQTNFISQNKSDVVAHAVRRSGGIPISTQLSSVDDSMTFNLSEPPKDNLVIPYGSTKLVRLGAKLGWLGCFLNDNFDVSVWNSTRDDMLNSDSIIVAAKDVSDFLSKYPPDLPMFIRPAYDSKAIAGVVQRVDYIRSWMNNIPTTSRMKPDTIMAVAKCKQIQIEWRWFVVGGKVIDGSIYRLHGQRLTIHETDSDVIAEAQRFADKWLPHKNCVMDLALTEQGMRCIEFNCLNSSGFYNNDVDKIVNAVNRWLE